MTEKNMYKQIRNINWELPSSIIELIFFKLPVYNLPSCRIVCKEWNDLIRGSKFEPRLSISSPWFAHFYSKIFCVECDPNDRKGMSTVASFDFDPKLCLVDPYLSIANSCNGLFCLFNRKQTNRNVCILNPMTNEYFKVSTSDVESTMGFSYGLGFSPKTKQYKIVRSFMGHDSSLISIQISAFGTNGTNHQWKHVDFLPLSCFSEFVYFNGGLYFLAHKKNCAVYRLDVEDEKLSKISLSDDFRENTSMSNFNDTLYLTTYDNDYLLHVWRMREDFSWFKVFVVDSKDGGRQFLYRIKVLEDETVLCRNGFGFVLHDPKCKTKLILTNQDLELKKKWMDFSYVTYQLWRVCQDSSLLQICSFNFNSLSKTLAGSD